MPDSIQECIDDDYDISVYCDARNCTHGQRLDLKELAKRLGPDHGVMHWDLADKFKCSQCGSKKVTIRIVPYASQSQAIVGAWTGKERR